MAVSVASHNGLQQSDSDLAGIDVKFWMVSLVSKVRLSANPNFVQLQAHTSHLPTAVNRNAICTEHRAFI